MIRIALLITIIALPIMAGSTPGQSQTAKPAVEEGYFTGADGVRLYYRKLGKGGEPVVFLHGGPGLSIEDGGYSMDPLAQDRTLIMYDQRGGGRSDLLNDPKLVTAANDVRDLEALRLHFGIERMTLVGLSWGSGLALLYATEHPDRVSRVVFLSPMPVARPYAGPRQEKINSLIDQKDKDRLAEIEKRSTTAGDDEYINLCREASRIMTRPYLYNPNSDTSLYDLCKAPVAAQRNAEAAFTAVAGSLGDWNFVPILAKLKSPALVIEGEKTNVPLDSTREWAKSPPSARLLLIPNAGHACFVDQPEVVTREIRLFLTGKWPEGAKKI